MTIAPASGATAVGHRRAELQPDLPGWHDHRAGHGDRDPADRATPWCRSAGSTPSAPDRTPEPPSRSPTPVRSASRSPLTSPSAVTCTVYNRAPNPPASIVVNKQWAITDTTSGVTTTFADGTQPSDLQAALTLERHAPAVRHRTRTGFAQGDTVAIAETVTNGLRGCVLGTPTMVRVGNRDEPGAPVHRHAGGRPELLHADQPGHLHHPADPRQDRQQRPGPAHRLDAERHRAGRSRRGADGHHWCQRAGDARSAVHLGRVRR